MCESARMGSDANCNFVLERINKQETVVLDQPEKSYTCGRGKENHIVCLNLVVSRKHCIFIRSTDQLYITDLKSSNGLFINGVPQEPYNMVKLHENDIIGIGCPDVKNVEPSMFAYKLHIVKSGVVNETPENSILSNTVLNPEAASVRIQNNNESSCKRINVENANKNVPNKIPKLDCMGNRSIIETGTSEESIEHSNDGLHSEEKIEHSEISKEKDECDIEIVHTSLKNTTNNEIVAQSSINPNVTCTNNSNKKDTSGDCIIKNKENSSIQEVTKATPCNNSVSDRSAKQKDDAVCSKKVQSSTVNVLSESTTKCMSNEPFHTSNHNLRENNDGRKKTETKSSFSEETRKNLQSIETSNKELDSFVVPGNFIINGDMVIKMEDELQITDDEAANKDMDSEVNFAVSPIKLKAVKQEPKTRFSEIDIVNLSDDEDDIFPCSQLFDDNFNMDPAVKVESKQEFPDRDNSGFHNPQETDVILLSDSEDEDNPWLQRLSRSQVIKEELDDIKHISDKSAVLNITDDDDFDTASHELLHKPQSTPCSTAKKKIQDNITDKYAEEEPSIPTLEDSSLRTDHSELYSSNGLHTESSVNTTIEKEKRIPLHKTLESSSHKKLDSDTSFNESMNRSTASMGKLSLSKKRIPEIEAPHMHKQRAKNKSSDQLKKVSSKPSTSKPSGKTKKEQKLECKAEEYFYKREQKYRKMLHRWAECLPPGKMKKTSLSKEERKQCIEQRKAKLKKIAEEKKSEDGNLTIKRPAKPKAKVSLKTRSDFLVEEQVSIATPSRSFETSRSDTDTSFNKIQRIRIPKKKVEAVSELHKENQVENSSLITNNLKHNASDTNKTLKVNMSAELSNKESENVVKDLERIDNRLLESKQKNVEALSNDEPTSIRPLASNTQKENHSPNKPALKKSNVVKKKVSFHENIVTIQEYNIDPGNTLRRLVGKDAPIPIDKLSKKPIHHDSESIPKLEDLFMSQIFQWNPVWLEEQRHLKMDPPVVKDGDLHATLTRYKSFEEYYKIFLPLLLLEFWNGITKEFENSKHNYKRPTVMCSIVENSITQTNRTNQPSSESYRTSLMLEVLVTKQDLHKQAHPIYGDLVFFEYVEVVNGKQIFHKVFAYVTSVHQTVITANTIYNKDLNNYVKTPFALLTYTMITNPLTGNIPANRVQRLRTVTYLRSNMRMVRAIQNLPLSPLKNLILSPSVESYQLPVITQNGQLITKDKLNTKQLEAVLSITEAVVQKEAKVCLVQGPPGTGKSKVIVNLVSQILYGDNRYKNNRSSLRILVCAPSNAAIDEIVLRLLHLRSKLKNNRFKMIRVGRPETMHPTAKEISVTELAKRDVKKTMQTYSSGVFSIDSFQQEKSRLQAQINALKCEIATSLNMDETYKKHTLMKLTDITTEYELLQNRKPMDEMDPKELAKLQRVAENKLLGGADIIACTLSSCYTNQMELIFGGSKERISVCIVDEATQSCEAETLIPLMLGVNTLVLVGDPNQLPATVISQRAKRLGLDQSLFSRVQTAFKGHSKNPIIMLDTQYRMAYPVSYWPNIYFYNGRLKNAAETNVSFPFHSYRVLNLDASQNDDKFSNTNEAEFVANLVLCMMNHTNWQNWQSRISVGILTPYNNQRSLMLTKIEEKTSAVPKNVRKNLTIEVNTVDSFQGQERDVIIMSCVRSHGIGFLSDRQRLCVALTRAKHCVIICGNFTTFMRDQMWKALITDARSRGVCCNVNASAPIDEIKKHIIR